MRWSGGLGAVAASCALLGASCTSDTLPPLGEVLVIVDTDAPVPRLVSRLRIDVYQGDGTWYASRDVELASPDQWPTSFGVYSPSPGATNLAIVRLRAYPDGMTRDYRGERYAARPTGGSPSALATVPEAPPGDAPRLYDARGDDVTPPREPQPLVSIDRLLVVETPANAVASTTVVLRGDCFGTMANLGAVSTCVDSENTLVTLNDPAPTSTDLTLPPSVNGAFGRTTRCTEAPRSAHTAADGSPLYDEEVCVPGEAFLFGSPVEYGFYAYDGVPQRIAVVDPFLMDRYELTVARWRDAVAKGLVEDSLLRNDGPLATDPNTQANATTLCTYSGSALGREAYPVNCITEVQARAFCQALGGDLPLEVQWEYAAAQADREVKTPFPWGGDLLSTPTCSEAIFGRSFDFDTEEAQPCLMDGLGPLGVDWKDDDVSIGLGIVKLAGNLTEFVRDSLDSLGSNCWMEQPLHMPTCVDPSQPSAARGGGWSNAPYNLYYGVRSSLAPTTPNTVVGVRCVRPGVKGAAGPGPRAAGSAR